MATTRKGASKVFTLRVDPDKLEQLRVIADRERRTLVSKLRVMIDDEVARAEREEQAA
jgi:predicted transcriptional regulator